MYSFLKGRLLADVSISVERVAMEKSLLRTAATVIVLAIVGLWAFNVLTGILARLMPLLILAGIGYVVYRVATPKSISGRSRRILR